MKHEELTAEVIQIFYKVYNSLGYGFLERVYENALKIEFRKAGLNFKNQVPIKVYYKGEIVGDYFADFIIDGKVVVEIKATLGLGVSDESQLLNYLRCTGKEVGLLLNFGKKAEVRRRVFNNVNKEGE
ncbi:GxxExxY protein [Candidatus Pacearchaeota archaeon]|nr:GxxExxY protein [Candidatus Pacearchaeota archaeon]